MSAAKTRYWLMAWAGAWALSLGGCSLVDLASEITVAGCQRNEQCEDLPRESDDECMAWLCNPETDLCEFMPLDRDHDGSQPAECVAEGEVPDCDDETSQRKPGKDEICDGLDNDCDDRTDEGELMTSSGAITAFDDDADITALALSADPGTSALGVAFGYAGDGVFSRLGGTVVEDIGGGTTVAGDLVLNCSAAKDQGLIESDDDCSSVNATRKYQAQQLAVSPFDANSMAVAFFSEGSGSKRVTAGLMRRASGDVSSLNVEESIQKYGLSCRADEDCRANGEGPDQPVGHPKSEGFSLAPEADGPRVAVAYLRNPDGDEPACDGKPKALKLHAHLLRHPRAVGAGADERGLEEVSDEPLVIDGAVALSSPLLMPLPLSIDGEGELGWLLAYQTAPTRVVLANLQVDGDALKIANPEVAVVTTDRPLQDLAASWGASANGVVTLGLAYTTGCTADSITQVRLIELSMDGVTISATSIGKETAVGGRGVEEGVSIAYHRERQLWAVSYRSPYGLQARLLEADGKVRGEESYRLLDAIPSGDDRRLFYLSTSTLALTSDSDDWFASIAYALDDGGDIARGLWAVRLRACQRQDE